MKCARCNKDIILQCSDDDPKRIGGAPVCEDCYYDEMGKMIELYPPGFVVKE